MSYNILQISNVVAALMIPRPLTGGKEKAPDQSDYRNLSFRMSGTLYTNLCPPEDAVPTSECCIPMFQVTPTGHVLRFPPMRRL